ncbi:MAG: aspartate/glutamate racemase family protein [Desulfofustis sp.]
MHTIVAKNHRIALIHATPVSIDPILAAFQKEWPDAEIVNLLDDSLGKDLNSGMFGADLIGRRIETLGNYGVQMGADGILYSCSAFGKQIDAVKEQLDIPVLKPNEAMFEDALMIGGKIGMIATFKPSIPSMEKEFYALADERGIKAQLNSIFVDDAMAALSQGDLLTHNNLIREASSVFVDYQVVMLAQFSASQASAGVEELLGCTVLTSPLSAVRKMKNTLIRKDI